MNGPCIALSARTLSPHVSTRRFRRIADTVGGRERVNGTDRKLVKSLVCATVVLNHFGLKYKVEVISVRNFALRPECGSLVVRTLAQADAHAYARIKLSNFYDS